MTTHPQSFRALGYEILNHLLAKTDDKTLNLPLVEQELRHQYGKALGARSQLLERQGAEPEAWRLEHWTWSFPHTSLRRSLEVPVLMTRNGRSYTTFVGIIDEATGDQTEFCECSYVWQLPEMVKLEERPCFVYMGNILTVQLPPEMALVDKVSVSGIPADPFPEKGRGDKWYWEKAWAVPEELKSDIKLGAISVFMNTHVRLAGRLDKKNNGIDDAS